jgi:hypothetical protein
VRDLTASVIAAITAPTVRPVVFYEGVYSSGTLRLWSGITSVSWNGQTWLGAGNLLNVAPIQEVSDVRAAGFAVSLSGDSSALLALNIGAARQGLGRARLDRLPRRHRRDHRRPVQGFRRDGSTCRTSSTRASAARSACAMSRA